MRAVKKILSAAVLIVIGTILVLPIEAKISSSGVTVKWVKSNYYTKKQIKKSYWTKGQTEKTFYRKNYINSLINGYYTSTQVDNALASYLTSSSASGTYLTQSNAASTYLTQTNAASTYLPLSGGTLTGGLSGTSITGTSFAYPSAQTRYKTIPARMFVPKSDAGVTNYTYTEGSNAMYWVAGNVYPQAGVDLPDGVTITGLTIYSYDNSASSMTLRLQYASLTAATTSIMATVSSSGSAGSAGYTNTTNTISDATVDNSSRYYFLEAELTNTAAALTFRGARITYTTTSVDTW